MAADSSYTPEEIAFMIVRHPTMTYAQIAEEMCAEFGRSYDAKVIARWLWRHDGGNARIRRFSAEEDAWIVEHWDEYLNSKEMAVAYQQEFGIARSSETLNGRRRHLLPGQHYGFSGGKKKGEGSSTTALPVGTEVERGGYVWIKVVDHPLPKNYTTEDRMANWQLKHRLMWEKMYGPVPEGHIIVFLNGNRKDFDPDNLYCISRKLQATLIRNNWYTDSREHTLTAIKWCELALARKNQCGQASAG